ncbi:unnamed protein product [Prunus armeniaca]
MERREIRLPSLKSKDLTLDKPRSVLQHIIHILLRVFPVTFQTVPDGPPGDRHTKDLPNQIEGFKVTMDTRGKGSGGDPSLVVFHGEGKVAFMDGGGFKRSIPPGVGVKSRT